MLSPSRHSRGFAPARQQAVAGAGRAGLRAAGSHRSHGSGTVMSVGLPAASRDRAEEGICGGAVSAVPAGCSCPQTAPSLAVLPGAAARCRCPVPVPGAARRARQPSPPVRLAQRGRGLTRGLPLIGLRPAPVSGRNDARGHGSAQPVLPRSPAGEPDRRPAGPALCRRALCRTGILPDRRPAGQTSCRRRPAGTAGHLGVSVASTSPRCPAQPCVPAASASSAASAASPRGAGAGTGMPASPWAVALAPGRAVCRNPPWVVSDLPSSASLQQGWSDGRAALSTGSGARLAVPGRQRAVLALAASPSAARSPGEGSFVLGAPSPAVAPAARGHWHWPGSGGCMWAGWLCGFGVAQQRKGQPFCESWARRGIPWPKVLVLPFFPWGTGERSGALRWGSPTRGQGGQTPALASPEKQPDGFVALDHFMYPQVMPAEAEGSKGTC
ncbi:transcription initiation factor TFIID subunit 4-like [Zonotrichia leucophrys gambelii]|uniref:transcription initiation factor TFIID subunit 4-like n=1 Tax=Zonotrichia leucophrys gambelii TaxID=257770 RepID=UPI0031404AB9